ncbi:MAG: transglutaminase domain-containing protein, partial [Anaerolineae bacterium]|nr:transglutaminase domain-containing protein [Anaerolineae bacterium]
APSIEVDEIVDYIRDLTEKEDEGAPGTGDAVAESLGLEQQPRPQKPNDLDKARVGGLPRRHLLGTGPELSRRVVMLIRTNEYAPMPQLPPGEEAPRYYWRGATYDNYTGRGWNTTSYSTVEYEPGGRSHVSELPFHRSIRQEVEVIGATGNLAHVAGQLVATDRAYKVAWRSSGDAFAATLVAKTYRADSLVAMATEDQLREARINYPPWILDRYMDLPETVPERVLALARDLTATAPTAYDRAVAIETYLRENFPYTLDVEPPPIHRDVADFFLFTTQEGYCDYYATAMVVLARAAGLPARLTVGYATGTYDPLEAAYIVTEADAHAWVEIYFPGYGWITFEPTGGRPPLDRSSDEEPLMWPDQPRESLRPAPVVRGPLARYWYLFIVGVAAAVLLLYLLGMQFDLLLLRLRPPAVVVTQLYHRLRRQAMKMGARLAPGDTPHEFSMILSQRIEVVSRRRLRENWVLPAAIEEAQRICETYVGVWYREDAPGSKERNARLRDWRRLRWRLLLVRFWSRPRSRLARLFAPARFGEAEVPGRAAQPSPMDQRY